jgi:hypothetical protein
LICRSSIGSDSVELGAVALVDVPAVVVVVVVKGRGGRTGGDDVVGLVGVGSGTSISFTGGTGFLIAYDPGDLRFVGLAADTGSAAVERRKIGAGGAST